MKYCTNIPPRVVEWFRYEVSDGMGTRDIVQDSYCELLTVYQFANDNVELSAGELEKFLPKMGSQSLTIKQGMPCNLTMVSTNFSATILIV